VSEFPRVASAVAVTEPDQRLGLGGGAGVDGAGAVARVVGDVVVVVVVAAVAIVVAGRGGLPRGVVDGADAVVADEIVTDATSLSSAVTVPKTLPVIVILPSPRRVTVPWTRSPFLKITSSAPAGLARASMSVKRRKR
jgi:hypothetical protein